MSDWLVVYLSQHELDKTQYLAAMSVNAPNIQQLGEFLENKYYIKRVLGIESMARLDGGVRLRSLIGVKPSEVSYSMSSRNIKAEDIEWTSK